MFAFSVADVAPRFVAAVVATVEPTDVVKLDDPLDEYQVVVELFL